jgi:branched-chain amino acid transport system ATP-binding protein
MTILLVEQNFRFARRIADRFYVMEDGKIVDAFKANELVGRMDRLHETRGL